MNPRRVIRHQILQLRTIRIYEAARPLASTPFRIICHMTDPRPTPLVASLPAVPFVGPGPGTPRGATSPPASAQMKAFSASPRVLEAIANAGRDAWMYGDPENFKLRKALAAHHGVPIEPSSLVKGSTGSGYLGA